MIDTHSHLNFTSFESDWLDIAERAFSCGVEKMIVVGTDLKTSQRAVRIAQKHPSLYAAVGIHPHHAKHYILEGTEKISKDIEVLKKLLRSPKVVAIGEVGLDYHVYTASEKYKAEPISPELIAIQKHLFTLQLNLANTHDKPVIIHSRKAKAEVLNHIYHFNNEKNTKIRGVFHCFEGGKNFTKAVLEAGLYISFTGNLTYDHGRAEVSKTVPLSRLLLETDCPYMPPRLPNILPVLRSEPAHVKIIGQFHADLRGIEAQEIYLQTTKNAITLFRF